MGRLESVSMCAIRHKSARYEGAEPNYPTSDKNRKPEPRGGRDELVITDHQEKRQRVLQLRITKVRQEEKKKKKTYHGQAAALWVAGKLQCNLHRAPQAVRCDWMLFGDFVEAMTVSYCHIILHTLVNGEPYRRAD